MSDLNVMWFRRDLRLSDHPALAAAAADGASVVGLFVLDPALLDSSMRTARLLASLRALAADLDGALVIRHGDPVEVVAEVATATGAASVHISADLTAGARRRDQAVADRLAKLGLPLVTTGSPYAVTPGRITKGDGTAFRVYTPFYKAWLAHGWPAPAQVPRTISWVRLEGDGEQSAAVTSEIDRRTAAVAVGPASFGEMEAGEAAALARWQEFRSERLRDYRTDRDFPAKPGVSRLSAALRFGEVHPRTLLADLDDSPGAVAYRRELAFRDFYADVQFHNPQAGSVSLDRRFDLHMRFDSGSGADDVFAAWCQGRTGYPFVDAGMRQLLAEGWMHNRVRLVVASFLVKDLHLPWWRGARWFFDRLIDGDPASNSQGWQWAAGCGTDAAPYFRVFNPVLQGKKFDPDGDYIRRYVPELRDVPTPEVHEPWLAPILAPDYPGPIVDHFSERDEALARYAEMKEAASASGWHASDVGIQSP